MSMPDRTHTEKEHFERVYGGHKGREALLIPDATLQLYRRCPHPDIYGKQRLFSLAQPLDNRSILEIGCGTGTDSVLLAAAGARVFAYDVSPAAILVAQRRAQIHGLQDRIRFTVASSPSAAYPGHLFDVVFGNAILHHLTLNGLSDTLSALLASNGKCVFREPVIRSSLLATLRRLVPWYPTNPSPDEIPLTDQSIASVAMRFPHVEIYYYELFSRFWYLSRSSALIAALHRWDAHILSTYPWVRRLASVAVFALRTAQGLAC